MKKLLPTHVLSALGIAVSSFAFAQNYQTMPIQSGLNEDVIANGIGTSATSTTSILDADSYVFVAKDFQATSTSTAITYGVPVDGIINSAVTSTPGLTYQLASLSAANSLRLSNTNLSGTITFTTPKQATFLYMLSTSGSGASTLTVTINFTDGTTQQATGVSLPDWYGGSNYAILGLGRINRNTDGLDSASGTNPRMYQSAFTIDAANITKYIQSVTITKTSTTNTIPNIFAFSVDAYSDCTPPVLQTPASITANSALASWTAATNAVSYDIYHSTSNTIPASNATPTYSGVSGTSQTIDGLNSNTDYYYWVRSNCSTATNQSVWSFGGTFKTACSTFTVPYTENFDTTSTGGSTNNNAPSCWAYLESSGFTGYGYVSSSYTVSTPRSFYMYNSTATTGSQMLISPPTVNLSDGTKQVSFSAKSTLAGTTLLVGTLANPTDTTTFTQIGSTITLTTTHTVYTVSIPVGTDVQLAFKHGMNTTGRNIYLDDITVENATLSTAEVQKKNEISIAPNPFKDIINISEYKDIKAIKVTDIAGRTLKTIENPEQQINLGELNAGLYLLNIQFKDGSQKTAKVIKK